MSRGDVFAPGKALRELEVLYADDQPHRRDVMRSLLLSLGVRRVQVAESGVEALKVFAGSPCGIVIAERDMAPMDGVTLIRAIRAVSNYPRALVPTLIVGEPAPTEVVAAALGAGANHFLVKPVTGAKLYERMQWVITDSRPFAVKDGHYVIKPGKPKAPAKTPDQRLAAAK